MKPAEFSQLWNQQATSYPSLQCLVDQIQVQKPIQVVAELSTHTVLLPFLWSHSRLFISHGFTNFKWVFSQTHNFLRKQTEATKSPVKKISSHGPLHTKNNIFLIFDSLWITKNVFGKHLSSINFVENDFLRIVFVIIWKFFRTTIKKPMLECFY